MLKTIASEKATENISAPTAFLKSKAAHTNVVRVTIMLRLI